MAVGEKKEPSCGDFPATKYLPRFSFWIFENVSDELVCDGRMESLKYHCQVIPGRSEIMARVTSLPRLTIWNSEESRACGSTIFTNCLGARLRNSCLIAEGHSMRTRVTLVASPRPKEGRKSFWVPREPPPEISLNC